MPDPVRLEVFKNLFSSIAEEMGAILGRAACSANIKERKDYSCALFDERGGMIAQAAHIPVHLGSMPLSVQAALEVGGKRDILLNDPFHGGTHLPDVTLVHPVFLRGKLAYFTACRAHWSDIGGETPGSMSVATRLSQEGIVIPPSPLTPRLRRKILRAVRNPGEVAGDLDAQLACCRTGGRRLEQLVSRYGRGTTDRFAAALQDYSRQRMEKAIRKIPPGRFRFEDVMDDDGVGGGPVRIRVSVHRRGSRVNVDFTGTDLQVAGNINAVYAVTLSAVLYCFRCLVPDDIPLNAGAAECIRVVAPEGSVVNARPPAAVAAGNVETSQRIVDVVFGALAQALPDVIPAASQGTMNNLSFGGKGFAYYETIAGGMGARPSAPGVSGVQTHMTNTMNTPIEAMEHTFPVRVLANHLRKNSGGKGLHAGGDGIVRELQFLETTEVSILSDRRKSRPWGLHGGKPGKPGRNFLDGKHLPAKVHVKVKPGGRIRIETPGGGGFGIKS